MSCYSHRPAIDSVWMAAHRCQEKRITGRGGGCVWDQTWQGCRPGGVNWPRGGKQDSDMLHEIPGIFELPTELLVRPSVPAPPPVDFESQGDVFLRTIDQHRLRPNTEHYCGAYFKHRPLGKYTMAGPRNPCNKIEVASFSE